MKERGEKTIKEVSTIVSNISPEVNTLKRTELRLPDELYSLLLDEVTIKKKRGENASLNQEIVTRLQESLIKGDTVPNKN